MSDPFEFDTEEQHIESIRSLIVHPAWEGYFKSEIKRIRDNAIIVLLYPEAARAKGMTDDYLRGKVHTLENLLTLGIAEVREADAARDAENQGQEYQEGLQEREEVGHMGPLSN